MTITRIGEFLIRSQNVRKTLAKITSQLFLAKVFRPILNSKRFIYTNLIIAFASFVNK